MRKESLNYSFVIKEIILIFSLIIIVFSAPPNCKKWSNNDCIECNENFFVKDKKCVRCNSENCLSCKNEKQESCFKCKDNFELIDGYCATNKCQKELKNTCDLCSDSQDICLKCKENCTKINNKCVCKKSNAGKVFLIIFFILIILFVIFFLMKNNKENYNKLVNNIKSYIAMYIKKGFISEQNELKPVEIKGSNSENEIGVTARSGIVSDTDGGISKRDGNLNKVKNSKALANTSLISDNISNQGNNTLISIDSINQKDYNLEESLNKNISGNNNHNINNNDDIVKEEEKKNEEINEKDNNEDNKEDNDEGNVEQKNDHIEIKEEIETQKNTYLNKNINNDNEGSNNSINLINQPEEIINITNNNQESKDNPNYDILSGDIENKNYNKNNNNNNESKEDCISLETNKETTNISNNSDKIETKSSDLVCDCCKKNERVIKVNCGCYLCYTGMSKFLENSFCPVCKNNTDEYIYLICPSCHNKCENENGHFENSLPCPHLLEVCEECNQKYENGDENLCPFCKETK